MSSSDDEADVPQNVTKYYFVDANEEPISFAVLPVHFEGKRERKSMQQVFLHGIADGGLQKVYKRVIAWKLGLEDDNGPEIFVLTRDKSWIQLLKPRQVYLETVVRSVLVTVQALHFLKRRPYSSKKGLANHLSGTFKSLERQPLVKDLEDHCSLMRLLVSRDGALAKSEV